MVTHIRIIYIHSTYIHLYMCTRWIYIYMMKCRNLPLAYIKVRKNSTLIILMRPRINCDVTHFCVTYCTHRTYIWWCYYYYLSSELKYTDTDASPLQDLLDPINCLKNGIINKHTWIFCCSTKPILIKMYTRSESFRFRDKIKLLHL